MLSDRNCYQSLRFVFRPPSDISSSQGLCCGEHGTFAALREPPGQFLLYGVTPQMLYCTFVQRAIDFQGDINKKVKRVQEMGEQISHITQTAILRKTAEVCRDIAVAEGRDFILTVRIGAFLSSSIQSLCQNSTKNFRLFSCL